MATTPYTGQPDYTPALLHARRAYLTHMIGSLKRHLDRSLFADDATTQRLRRGTVKTRTQVERELASRVEELDLINADFPGSQNPNFRFERSERAPERLVA